MVDPHSVVGAETKLSLPTWSHAGTYASTQYRHKKSLREWGLNG